MLIKEKLLELVITSYDVTKVKFLLFRVQHVTVCVSRDPKFLQSFYLS